MHEKWYVRVFRKYLQEGEQMYAIVHRHWMIVIVGVVKVMLFGFILPFALYLLFAWISIYVTLVILLWWLFGFIRLTYVFFNWYLDAWILTDQALIDVRWDGFFKRSAERIEYKSIEKVSYAFNGFFQTILGYGTLKIQQSGGEEEISYVEHLKEVANEINGMQEKISGGKKYEEAEAIKEILSHIVSEHIKKHGLRVKLDER